MIDWAKPLETPNGKPARLIGTYNEGFGPTKYAVAVNYDGSEEFFETVDSCGKSLNSGKVRVRNERQVRYILTSLSISCLGFEDRLRAEECLRKWGPKAMVVVTDMNTLEVVEVIRPCDLD